LDKRIEEMEKQGLFPEPISMDEYLKQRNESNKN